mmetsp:Transcript_19475/g.55807  ORF Transcript_19475/g.55807 Transcript_19475/m.55807 type:complete len:222 (+) Transcript_19475:198-863(+)
MAGQRRRGEGPHFSCPRRTSSADRRCPHHDPPRVHPEGVRDFVGAAAHHDRHGRLSLHRRRKTLHRQKRSHSLGGHGRSVGADLCDDVFLRPDASVPDQLYPPGCVDGRGGAAGGQHLRLHGPAARPGRRGPHDGHRPVPHSVRLPDQIRLHGHWSVLVRMLHRPVSDGTGVDDNVGVWLALQMGPYHLRRPGGAPLLHLPRLRHATHRGQEALSLCLQRG